jgi:hypothetical protein
MTETHTHIVAMPLQVVGGVEKCFLRLKKICFLNKTRLLACSVSLKELCGAHSSTSKRSFPNWEGGGDDGILWWIFAQQK